MVDGDSEIPKTETEPENVTTNVKAPAGKRRKIKSPTPGELRGRSATPVKGRSQTPFSVYLNRRSATPMGVARSITPFLNRSEKEKTPFELGKDIKSQLVCNKMVFDKALYMDITENEEAPIRYITSDMSVIDRAAVMDISNVEVIYVVEEYEEEEPEEEKDEEVVVKKKGKKGGKRGKSASVEMRSSESPSGDHEEKSLSPAKEKKTKKKEKKEKKEKSPSPILSLKLEIGGGPKVNRKMFDQPASKPDARPPPKKAVKSKLALQMEEQAKAAAKAAEEATMKQSQKQNKQTSEENNAKVEEEENEELKTNEAQLDGETADEAENEDMEENDDEEGGENDGDMDMDEDAENASQVYENESSGGEMENSENEDDANDQDRKDSNASSIDDFIRPDPEEEERWKKIAEEEGEEFAQKIRKFVIEKRMKRSEKERDADWQKQREQSRLPTFINYLTDRAAEEGQTIRLACAVSGPELSVKWFKDGRQLEPGKRIRLANNNNILSLQISDCELMDCGEYSCVISNLNDEVTSSCIVTIYQVFKDEPSPPTFSLIRDFYHLHDDELTIETHIHGIPRPKIKWFKDNFQVNASFKFTLLEEAHGVYKLLIFRPSAKDSGKYICKAVNSCGEAELSHMIEFTKPKHFHARGVHHAHNIIAQSIEAEAKKAIDEAMKSKAESDARRPNVSERKFDDVLVSPKQKLQFATHLKDRMALEKANVRLISCILGPNPAIKWLKDDAPLQWGPKIKNLSVEGQAILELSDVGFQSSGVYKLIAKNDFSEIDSSCYLKVYSAKKDGDESEPMFCLPIKDSYRSSENDLIISTKIRANPWPVIKWFKDELQIPYEGRIQQIEHLDGTCELVINNPSQKDDGGIYTCTAENSLGSVKSTHTVVIENLPRSRRSSRTSLNMTKHEETPPKSVSLKKEKHEKPVEYVERAPPADLNVKDNLYFIVNLKNHCFPEGSRCKIQALIGGPDPQIKWLKNNQPIVYGPKVRNLSNSGMAILEFNKATSEDSGSYTLIARNQANEITATSELTIYTPTTNMDEIPVFTRALKDTYRSHRNELVLESHFHGSPLPEIDWYKDSIKITNNERYKITATSDGRSELIIDKPNKNDSGKYVCTAENHIGKCELSHIVVFGNEAHHMIDNKNVRKQKLGIDEIEESQKGASASKKENQKEEIQEIETSSKQEKREKRIGIYFATTLKDRVVAVGTKVKLTCFVESAEPAVKWFRNDEPIAYGPKMRQSFNQGLCALEVTSAILEDSGIFKCVAKDGTGEVSTSCKMEVYSKPSNADVAPTFTRSIKDSYHYKMNEMLLDVHVRAWPAPTISWVKDGMKLEQGEKYQMNTDDDGSCELFIYNPLPKDSGKYICKAENYLAEAEISHFVHVDVANLRSTSPVNEIKVKNELTNGETVDANKKTEVATEKKGKKAEKESETEYSRYEEAVPDTKRMINFGNFLSNRTVVEGSTVRMTVYINGPDPQCRWYKNDDVVTFSPKTKMSCNNNIAVLVLSELSESDSAQYKLVATGTENTIETVCTVMVYKAATEELFGPVFTVGIKDTYTLHEDELMLECRVRGNPQPKISWLKDNAPIAIETGKYKQLEVDGYSKLVINNPSVKDSGKYTCVAENSIKTEQISHEVVFGGQERFIQEKTLTVFHRDPNKPHFLAPLGNHIVSLGGTLAIQAEFAQSNSEISVQWFKDKIPLTKSPSIRKINDRGIHTLIVDNLTESSAGVYTCRAVNDFGKTESCANVHVSSDAGKSKMVLFLSRPDSEMKIAAGDQFSISFKVQGDPKPKLTLLKGTKDITRDERVTKEVSDDFTRFTVHNASLSDNRTYFVVARNEISTDKIFVTITVKHPKNK